MAHWRDTYRPARFFFLDARAGIPLVLTLLHVRYWTVGVSCAVILLFYYLERIGIDAMGAARGVRAYLVGKLRPARRYQKTRGRIDYDRRPVP